jgi:hypothetical protein
MVEEAPAVVDVVLWRFATLHRGYLQKLSSLYAAGTQSLT